MVSVFRAEDVDLRGLVTLISKGDARLIKSTIDKCFPEAKDLWLSYKGGKMLPLVSIERLLKVKSKPYLTSKVIEDNLTYTGLVGLRSAEDINLLKRCNPTDSYVTGSLDRVWNREKVAYVRFFLPASVLLILLTGDVKGSISLQKALGIKVSILRQGKSALLSKMVRTLRMNNVGKEQFYVWGDDGKILNLTVDRLGELVSSKRVKEVGKDKELLTQPNVRKVRPSKRVVGSKEFLTSYLEQLKQGLELCKSMEEDTRRKIGELQTILLIHQGDRERFEEQMAGVETLLSVAGDVEVTLPLPPT